MTLKTYFSPSSPCTTSELSKSQQNSVSKDFIQIVLSSGSDLFRKMGCLSFPLPALHPLYCPSPPFSLPSFLLRTLPLNTATGSGERCKLLAVRLPNALWCIMSWNHAFVTQNQRSTTYLYHKWNSELVCYVNQQKFYVNY